jgi:hypothetical protein
MDLDELPLIPDLSGHSMNFRSNVHSQQFTRLNAQIIQEDGAFTVSVRMDNHENSNDRAWGQEIAASFDMASAMIESIAKQFSILENSISIKIVMQNFKDGTLH